MIFDKFDHLEADLDVGDHTPGKLKMESTFDKLRREWAQKVSTVDQVKKSASADSSTAVQQQHVRVQDPDVNFHSDVCSKVLGEGQLDFLPK